MVTGDFRLCQPNLGLPYKNHNTRDAVIFQAKSRLSVAYDDKLGTRVWRLFLRILPAGGSPVATTGAVVSKPKPKGNSADVICRPA